MSQMPHGWAVAPIVELLAPLSDGRIIHQGWSPQCAQGASPNDDVWGVLKTTSIQDGKFLPEHNKLLPDALEPRSLLEGTGPGERTYPARRPTPRHTAI